MKVWTDKKGKELTYKEFIGRWKEGIQKITPLQQARVQVRSTIIMLIGILAGIIVSIMNFNKIWWVTIILVGVFGFTFMQFVGLMQKKNVLENFRRGYIG